MKYLFNILIIILLNTNIFAAKTVNIYPTPIKQNSGIYVKKGDILDLNVSGKWTLWDKYAPVGGEGHASFKANDYGNWGTLLGQIGNQDIFIVGTKAQIVSKFEGVLYLFPNKGPYIISNSSGNLEVTITGGSDFEEFKKNLADKSLALTYNLEENILSTNLYFNKGDQVEIYVFGYENMWKNYYPEVSAEGHDYLIEGVNWGKMHGGIGTSFGEYLNTFIVGEKTVYTVKQSGILSLFPYTSNYKTDKSGKLDIFIIGGKQVNDQEKLNTDLLINKIIENKILIKLNEFRTISSLPSVEINQNLTLTAFNHAKYLSENNEFTREEITEKQFFTGETLEIRLKKQNFINQSYEMLIESNYDVNIIDMFINTVYHRNKLLNPNLKYIGYGFYKKNNKTIYVLDMGFIEDKDLNFKWEIIAFPPTEYTEYLTSWDGIENPDPLPIGTNKPLGSPVSITFNKKIIKVISAEMIKDDKTVIPCFIITPENDLNNKITDSVILIPKIILNINTKYIIKFKVMYENKEEKEYTWPVLTVYK